MSRFKELRRLEKAIEDQNEHDLKWALLLCEQRMAHASMTHHKKFWTKQKERVTAAMTEKFQ